MVVMKTLAHIIEKIWFIPSVKKNFFGILRNLLTLVILAVNFPSYAQNTATASGNWSACPTWGNPQAIYRNTTDTKTINNGITVTADTNWSTAAIVLNGNGGVNYNSGVFTDFVNDQGADMTCDGLRNVLASTGCASCTAYDNASSGQYIPITQAEYNALKSNLSNVTLAGSNDYQLYTQTFNRVALAQTVSIGVNQTKVPASSYIVAFAFQVVNASAATAKIKLKYNTTANANSGYVDYGFGNYGSFPMTDGVYYFMIKSPSQKSYSGGSSYIAHYCDTAGMMVSNAGPAYVEYFADSNTLSTSYNNEIAIQIVTSNIKQW